MDDELSLSESINFLRELLKEQSFTIAEIWIHLSKNCKQFLGQNTETLRSFLVMHSDEFELNDDFVSLKIMKESHSLNGKNSEIKNVPMNSTMANGGKKIDLPITKLNIPKKEVEVLHALVQLVSDKSKMTLPMLAANMSSLSADHRAVIGQGQKAIQKYIKKYPEVFTVTGDIVSISPKLHLHSSISENYLQQVMCIVTKIGSGFGFLSTPDDNVVYFGANNFEGGNCQDLNKHLKVGDLVIVDAEKGDPNYTADWRAIKVCRMKKQPSESLGSHSGSCTSLDRISLSSSLKYSNDDSSAECDKSRRLSSSSSGAVCNQPNLQQEVITFLETRIKSRGGKISLQNLTGHLSSLSNNLRDHIGYKLEDLRTFIKNNNKYFVLENDLVYLVSSTHSDHCDNNSNSQSVASNSTHKKNDSNQGGMEELNGDIHYLDAFGGGLIRLTNGKLVPFEAKAVSDSIDELKKGLVVFCSAENSGNKLHITKIWQPPTNAYGMKHIPISGYTGVVVRVFPEYGFINYGISTEDNIYFQKTYVEGVSEKDNLTDVLRLGSKVICDAVHAENFSSKYRAIRVIPLTNEEGFKTVTSRHNKKPLVTDSSAQYAVSDEKEVYVSDEEWDYESSDNKLHMCSGRIVSLYPTYGFIQRGNRGKDPENVYFNNLVFITDSGKPVDNLMDILKIGDIVNYDAERGRTESCKWRATAVGKIFNYNSAIQTNEEMLVDRTGTIVKIFPSKGIISFGPHPYFERVFFSMEFYYRYLNKVTNLTSVLNIGDQVNFTAIIDEAGMKTKWKATLVWTGEKPIFPSPSHSKFPDYPPDVGLNNSDECLKGIEGYVTTVFPTKGLLAFGSTMYSSEVFFTIDCFYDNCKMTKNLQAVLKEKDLVTFDAVVDKPGLRTKWRAVLVWTGRRPNVVTEMDKKIQLKNFLSQSTCHFYNPHFDNSHMVTLEASKKSDMSKRVMPLTPVLSPSVSDVLSVKSPFEPLKRLEENNLISDDFPSLDITMKKDPNPKEKLNTAGVLSYSNIISRMSENDKDNKNKAFTNAYNSMSFLEAFEENHVNNAPLHNPSPLNNPTNAIHNKDNYTTNIDFLKQGETVLQELQLNESVEDISEKDSHSVVTIESGKTGIIEKLIGAGGYIKATTKNSKKNKSPVDENFHVWFNLDNLYVNETRAKISDIKVGDTVHFNVKCVPGVNDKSAWEATLVWKGRKPKNSNLSEGSRTSNKSSELNDGTLPISDESFSFSSTDIDDNIPLNLYINEQPKPLEHQTIQKLYKSPASQRSRSLSPSVNPAILQHFTRKNSADNKSLSLTSAKETNDIKTENGTDSGIFSRKTCSLEDLPKFDPFSIPNLDKSLINQKINQGIGLKDSEEKELIPWDDDIPKEKWPTLGDDDLSSVSLQAITRADVCRPLAEPSNRSRILTDNEHTIVNKNPFSHWQMGNSFLFDSSSDDKQQLYSGLRSLWGSGDPISKNNHESELGKDIFKKLNNASENLSTYSMDMSANFFPETSSNETSLSDITEKCIHLMKYVQEKLKKREQEAKDKPINDFRSIQNNTEVTKVDSSTQTISTGDISSHHIYSEFPGSDVDNGLNPVVTAAMQVEVFELF